MSMKCVKRFEICVLLDTFFFFFGGGGGVKFNEMELRHLLRPLSSFSACLFRSVTTGLA